MKLAVPLLEPGSAVAGYRIQDVIGRGGMGIVYRATQVALERIVALKLIAPELADDPAFRRRFEREAKIAASIDHPHVIPVYEAGENEGFVFIAMRYVRGRDLDAMIADEPLPPKRAAELVAQIGSALDAAHALGLVHRDVKPANVLVETRDGVEHAFLTDFGLSRSVKSTSGVTRPGEFAGTVDYLSPEQIRDGEADARSDVYGLGCLLHHALTGDVPFPRTTDAAKLWAHVNDAPVHVSELRPGVPRAFDSVVVRALAKDPGERFEAAGELGRAAVAASTGRRLRPEPRGQAVGGTAAVPLQITLPWRRRTLAVAGGLLAAAAIAAVALVVTLSGSDAALVSVPADSVGRIDPETNRIVAATRVGSGPTLIAAGGGAIWVANADDRTLSRIDPSTGKELRRIATEGTPTALAVGEGAVWVAHKFEGTVRRLDPGLNETTAVVPVGHGVAGVAVGAGAVWAVNNLEGTVIRINPATAVVDKTIEVGGSPEGIAVGAGAVWVASGRIVLRVDPAGGAVTRIAVRSDATDVAVGMGAVWVSNRLGDSVTKIDPRTGAAATAVAVGDEPVGIAAGAGAIWVANRLDGSVSRINPTSRAVVATIEVGDAVNDVVVHQRRVWVTAPAR